MQKLAIYTIYIYIYIYIYIAPTILDPKNQIEALNVGTMRDRSPRQALTPKLAIAIAHTNKTHINPITLSATPILDASLVSTLRIL